jgi:hypothetical protein
MKKAIKFPLVLGIVALCSGLLLSGTYNLTKNTIIEHKVERQTSALKNLFSKISDSDELTLNDEDTEKGITSAIKVISENKTYYTYQITFADLQGGEETSFILVLDSNGAIYKLEFVTLGDNYASKYNNDNFKNSIVGVTSIGKDLIVTGATNTGTPMFEAINQAFDNYGRVK